MDAAAVNRVALAASIVDLERILPSYQQDGVGIVVAQAGAAMENASACIAAAALVGRRFDVVPDPRNPPEAVAADALLLATFPRIANNVDLRRTAAHLARCAKGAMVVLCIVGDDVEAAARQIRGEPGVLVAVCRRETPVAAAPIVPIAPVVAAPVAAAADTAPALTGPTATGADAPPAEDASAAVELPKAA